MLLVFKVWLFCLQSIEPADIIIGVVSAIIDSGLILKLLCFDEHKNRDIDELNVNVSLKC